LRNQQVKKAFINTVHRIVSFSKKWLYYFVIWRKWRKGIHILTDFLRGFSYFDVCSFFFFTIHHVKLHFQWKSLKWARNFLFCFPRDKLPMLLIIQKKLNICFQCLFSLSKFRL
jgi:hypothetical protein